MIRSATYRSENFSSCQQKHMEQRIRDKEDVILSNDGFNRRPSAVWVITCKYMSYKIVKNVTMMNDL